MKATERLSDTDEELWSATAEHHAEIEKAANVDGPQPPWKRHLVVGWYVSHVRDSLVLRPADREVFERHFKEPWQVTLVVRPGPEGSLRAGMFRRRQSEAEAVMLNTVDLDGSGDSPEGGGDGAAGPEPEGIAPPVTALAVAAAAGVESRAVAVPSGAPAKIRNGRSAPVRAAVAEPETETRLDDAPPFTAIRPARRPRFGAALLVVLAVALFGAGAGTFYYLRPGGPDSVSLQANEREGVLMFEWNGTARDIAGARVGKLEIADGESKKTYDLSAAELHKGAFALIRKNEDVTAKLVLTDGVGRKREEIARYLGHPVAAKNDPRDAEIQALQQQVEALRAKAAVEKSRADELQSWVDVLESTMKKRGGLPQR